MEERKKVLELVSAGHLTVDEADRLLAALEGAKRPAEESSQLEDVIADCVSGRVKGAAKAFRFVGPEGFEFPVPDGRRVIGFRIERDH